MKQSEKEERNNSIDWMAFVISGLLVIVIIVDIVAGKKCNELAFILFSGLGTESLYMYSVSKEKLRLGAFILLFSVAIVFLVEWISSF